MEKKLPYGVSNFRDLIQQNYLYVDKTKYIEILENYNEKYIFFLRPRRFGKSLFVSMLSTYYDINAKDEFAKLFKGLYIGENPTPLVHSYYILHINFSGMNTSCEETLVDEFTHRIVDALNHFCQKYGVTGEYKAQGMPSQIFMSFLTQVAFQISGKIYVLIDEYDHFANELLSFQTELFEETVSKTGFVRKWYETLKIGTERGIVDRIFATGVSPVTLDGLTSGFNIASNVTRDGMLNEMVGFNEKEVMDLLREMRMDQVEAERILPDLRKYYNGYLFSERGKGRVFNSDMVLYYLNSYQKVGEPPLNLIDTNISSDYAKMQKLFTLKNRDRNYWILENILSGKSQTTAITPEFSMAKEFTEEDFLSLLFYLGYLTIEERVLNRVRLNVPNYAVKELYFAFFAQVINERLDTDLVISEIKDSIESIALKGDVTKFIGVVEKNLQELSGRDFIKFDEKYIKIIMLTYLTLSKLYYVKSEYEVKDGYIDIAIFQYSGTNDGQAEVYEGLFEIKYIKKADYEKEGQSIVDKKLAEGKAQLTAYQDVEELRNRKDLLKWVMVFASDRCVRLEKL